MIANLNPPLKAATFAAAFARFRAAVLAVSGEPFQDFGSGLAIQREGYKEWVYHNGRIALGFDHWKPSHIGSGEILQKTINAIQLHHDARYRNNLVEWNARYGDKSRVHIRLLEAQGHKAAEKKAEQVLFDLYSGGKDDEQCFESLVEVAGRRYELISYLFYLKDWTRYMPVRTTAFSESFEQLGVPHSMIGKCSWDNYKEYIARLQAVQSELASYGVSGNRLIDAHSFCWMLVKLPEPSIRTKDQANWIRKPPNAAIREDKVASGQEVGSPIDYSATEEAKRRIGALAQLRVLNAEIQRLQQAGRSDLAQKVEDVSANAALGYDIRSFHDDSSEKLIEVKAASVRSTEWRFFLTENERTKSLLLPGYVFALVQDVESTTPTIWEFSGGELPPDALRPVNYEVRIKAP